MIRRFPPLALALTLTLSGVGVGCAVNPVTGERQLSFFSERQEIQIGQEADQEIVPSLGLMEEGGWQEYLQELGDQMARESERPGLPWTFRAVDDHVVNAFALPGGYIYITRGILAHFNSEAELAGVLGHEIGHVTARHGVSRVSWAQLAQVGLGLGTILAPEGWAPLTELAGAGMGLLFLSYGRDAERQADDLGLRYMTREGYDPRQMALTFEMLANASGAREGGQIPAFLSSHPDPMERRDRILSRVEAGELSGERVERESYLQRLDGMVFGTNPRHGFFRNGLFHHPDMAFRMTFPQGWQTQNQRTGVQGVSAEQDGALLLTLSEAASAREARDQFVAGEGIQGSSLRDDTVNGLTASRADFLATTQEGALQGAVLFVEHDGQVFRLLGYAPQPRWEARSGVIRAALSSFQRETDAAILGAQPNRIRLQRTPVAMTIEAFHQSYPSAVQLETVATINHRRPGVTIPAGTLLKRVLTGG